MIILKRKIPLCVWSRISWIILVQPAGVVQLCAKTGLYGRLLQLCEGSSHVIHCHGSKRIRIISADYGCVTGGHICGGPIRTTNCGAARALSKVRRNCQGRWRCVLYAANSVFGDPCWGTKKYLEVRSQAYQALFREEGTVVVTTIPKCRFQKYWKTNITAVTPCTAWQSWIGHT